MISSSRPASSGVRPTAPDSDAVVPDVVMADLLCSNERVGCGHYRRSVASPPYPLHAGSLGRQGVGCGGCVGVGGGGVAVGGGCVGRIWMPPGGAVCGSGRQSVASALAGVVAAP